MIDMWFFEKKRMSTLHQPTCFCVPAVSEHLSAS